MEKGKGESGMSVLEFALVGALFFTITFGIVEVGRLFYTHNELVRATRRAARYAVLHQGCPQEIARAKNVAVYGKPDPITGDKPIINDLTTSDIVVTPSTNPAFGVNRGSVEVTIDTNVSTGYRFNFIVKLNNLYAYFDLPTYKTVLPAESAGCEGVVSTTAPCSNAPCA